MTTSIYKEFTVVGMALDPIHVGTGGARLGRVDLTIVRDPVTRVPKIPGSSLAGVYRSYAAMQMQEQDPQREMNGKTKPYFPDCAGQGQADPQGQGGHCGQPDCPICVCFGFAKGQGGGFAGLAAFSDAHVLLFPVATREGPIWITSPSALRQLTSMGDQEHVPEDAILRQNASDRPLNLGWLLLPVQQPRDGDKITETIGSGVPDYIRRRWGAVSDKLFSHVVNSNLEVRTSVSIDPSTGAAEEGALFSYEALPRTTVLVWTVTCRTPKHFKVGGKDITAVKTPDEVFDVVRTAHPYLEHLGIGGMGTRGMGRLRVLSHRDASAQRNTTQAASETGVTVPEPAAQPNQEAS